MAEAASLESQPARSAHAGRGDLFALVLVSLIWGTTWYAITLQLKPGPGGEPPPPAMVSVVYRFALAAALLFGWSALTRKNLRLSRAQHLTSLGQGVFVFGSNYAFVYLAEARIASAVTAVAFAGLAFLNLILFRLVFAERATRTAWIASALGLGGVLVTFLAELERAHMDARAFTGLGFAALAVLGAGIGNLFSHRAHAQGAEVAANTAWAMAYGAGLLLITVAVSGQHWTIQLTPAYLGSLAYLSVFGSVVAFLLYFNLARSRGWTLASYISAVTPILAMAVSALFEHARWGPSAFIGMALVVGGQVLLIRGRR